MKLSVLIPTYNYDLTELVGELYRQCEAIISLEYEILCYDDCSDNADIHNVNNKVNDLPNVTYVKLKQNIGRSKIRNLLADKASGDWLLFLDCDGLPCHKDFIKNYLLHTDKADVVCGGTKYIDKTQIERKYLLHWTNGKAREENQEHFTTNNFFIRKNIFTDVRFDETLWGYGHEDTVFGAELEKKNYKILHIDNAVYHLGLKETSVFLRDISNAEINLRKIYNNPAYTDLLKPLSIIRTYRKLERLHLVKVYYIIVKMLQGLIVKQLYSNRPSLLLLDIYKLRCFIGE